MLVTGIKSKPVYAPLRADPGGRYHLLLGSGPGVAPLLQVLAELRSDAPESLARSRVLFAPDAADASADARGASAASRFAATGVADVHTFADSGALLGEFESRLAASVMGLRLYVAGPERFIGLAMKTALQFNLNTDEIRAQECGSKARRVRCVHCRETTEDVRTNIVQCIGCRRWLLVRDHYSRRLAAYMGVMVDAEAPGQLPAVQEIFP
jgi:ferredoxin-NADP reductase